MYLKTIELYGFKSFADRTKIELENGVTCIVGPNGSGKSNITDSIKWTLGEQSTKVLRGNKMEDVIFSGTKKRRSLGMCEVILTFDNSDFGLDSEYSEVSIKRKLYKNGDSEYYINDKPCRLKDIRDLTEDTGIGKDGYSIIGQGKIDEILNSKPEDRRFIFEEAAGISGYRNEKKEAEKKLSNTEENLNRIKDILSEIRNQEKSLKIESEKAIQYQEFFDKLKALEIYNATKSILKSDEKLLEKEKILEKNRIEKNSLDEKKEEISLKTKELNEKSDRLEASLNELQLENIDNIREEKEKKSKIAIFNERKISKNAKILNLKSTSTEAEEKLKSLDEEIEKIANEALKLKEKLADLNSQKDEITRKTDFYEEDFQRTKAEAENLKNENLKIDEKIQALKIAIEKHNSLIFDRAERMEEKSKNEEALQTKIANSKEKISENEKLFEEFQTKNKNLEEEIRGFSEKTDNLKAEKEKLQAKNFELLNKINAANSKLKLYKSMEDSYEGYYKTIRDFYSKKSSQNKNFPALHDALANLIKVDRKYERAISTALGSNMQSLVVETFEDAREIISYLKKENIGKITFLPLDNIKGRNFLKKPDISGFVDFACNLVKFDKIYENIISFLLGNVIIARDLESGNEISKKTDKRYRVVTLDGDVINAGGSVTGGTVKNESGIFYRKNEIARLKDLSKDLNDEKKTFENRLFELENLLKADSEIYSEKLLQKEKFDFSIENLQREIYAIKVEKENLEKNLKNSREELENIKAQNENADLEILKLNKALRELKEDKAKKDAKISILEKKLSEIEMLSKNDFLKQNELNIEISEIGGKIGYLNSDNERIGNEKNAAKIKIENSKFEIEKLELELQEEENKNEENLVAVKIIEKEIEEFKIKNENLIKEKKFARQKYYELIEEEKNINDQILEVERNIFESQSLIERFEEDADRISEKISENYNFTLLKKLPENLKIEKPEIKESISYLKREIKKLGSVNKNAVISYKKVKERLEFNEKQFDDLVASKEKLEEFLKKIQVIMQNQFAQSFKIINKNFKKVFIDMFGGGAAELKLSEGELLDAGIEISATPPGKKTKTMDLLSGGERALTAISLLFAFLETKPAPFCLLDEIDSALDEANIIRFINYLKNMHKIQFLIITHRKTTMNVADILYGVTMEEPGVSKIISMKFNEEAK